MVAPALRLQGTVHLQANSKTPSTWADILKNGGITSELDLDYVAPITINGKKVRAANEEVSGLKSNGVVRLLLMSLESPYHHFKAFMTRTWNH